MTLENILMRSFKIIFNAKFSWLQQNTNHFAFSLIKRWTDHTVVKNHCPFISLNTFKCCTIIVPGAPFLKIKEKDSVCLLKSAIFHK